MKLTPVFAAAIIAVPASVLAQQPVEIPPPSQSPPWKIVNQHGQDVECDTSPWQKVDLGTVAGVHIYFGDHCSVPSSDPLSEKYKQVFSHSCDLHDICYVTPGNTKSYCDDLVKWRWDRDCEHAYASSNTIGREACKVTSTTWRAGLNNAISNQYWARSQDWGRQHCRLSATAASNAGRAAPVSWTRYQGELPAGAVYAGNEVVCRAAYQGGVHPGRLAGSNCIIGYGGREVSLADGEVLHATVGKVAWVTVLPNGAIPGQPVVGGAENGQPRPVCRARVAGTLYGGKLVGGNCNVGAQGREFPVRPFDVLVLH